MTYSRTNTTEPITVNRIDRQRNEANQGSIHDTEGGQ